MLSGIQMHIAKPVETGELLAVVASLVGRGVGGASPLPPVDVSRGFASAVCDGINPIMKKGLLVVGFTFLALAGYAGQLEFDYKPLSASLASTCAACRPGLLVTKMAFPSTPPGCPQVLHHRRVVRFRNPSAKTPSITAARSRFAVKQGGNGSSTSAIPRTDATGPAISTTPSSCPRSAKPPRVVPPGWLDDADYLVIRTGS